MKGERTDERKGTRDTRKKEITTEESEERLNVPYWERGMRNRICRKHMMKKFFSFCSPDLWRYPVCLWRRRKYHKLHRALSLAITDTKPSPCRPAYPCLRLSDYWPKSFPALSKVLFSFNSTIITSVFVSPIFSPMCICAFIQTTLPALTSTSFF
jgi:hypothetical protein